MADGPFAFVVVDPFEPGAVSLPLHDRIFVGRECAGVDEMHRILLNDDPAISRNHLELRVDSERSTAVVVDLSSNGTRVNGIRVERSVGVPLGDQDLIQLGTHILQIQLTSATSRSMNRPHPRETVSLAKPSVMVLVVGDLINFSTVSEYSDQQVLAGDIDRIYAGLRSLLWGHRGTLIDYVGDAFFAGWELDADSDAVANALQFSIEASELIDRLATQLQLRNGDGSPLTMGWGATIGSVIRQLMPGAVLMVLGDATNLAFRISSIAGRESRAAILATQELCDAAGDRFVFGPPETVTVKGRSSSEIIRGVIPGRPRSPTESDFGEPL